MALIATLAVSLGACADGEANEGAFQKNATEARELSPGAVVFTLRPIGGGNDELWVTYPDDGSTFPLLQTDMHAFEPTWAPDGSTIAFTGAAPNDWSETNIFTLDIVSGKISQITTDDESSSPSWSPDSTMIAFESSRSGHREIWLMSPSGQDQRQLTNSGYAVYPKWSPDGDAVLFGSAREEADPDNASLTITVDELSLVNTITGEVSVVPNSRGSSYGEISPDGSKIALLTSTGPSRQIVEVMGRDGTDRHPLSDTPGFESGGTWSHDGDSILFARSPADSGGGYERLFLYQLSDEQIQEILPPDDDYAYFNPDELGVQ